MTNVAGAAGLKPFRLASLRGAMEKRCDGQHDIYVAEVLYIAADGKLVVVTVCRNCDTVKFHEQLVTTAHTEAVLLKQKENVK